MEHSASAKWQGSIKEGSGSISTESGVLKDVPYGFNSRFGGGSGTNPEELLGAAHAGCFTMAVAAKLTEGGLEASSLTTSAKVTLEKSNGDFTITAVRLTLVAKVPGANEELFNSLVNEAKNNCPVSKLFKATISLDARLED